MTKVLETKGVLPLGQKAIQAACFHPTGSFVEFQREDIEQSIPDRFETIVRRYRDRLAFEAGDRSLTYDELNQAANGIAWAILAKCGAGHHPIALLLEHSIDLVPALLGALKAGKFFVVIEPSLPVERIQRILRDARPTLIVTDSRNKALADRLQGASPPIIHSDELNNSPYRKNPGLALLPQAIAYLIYTSGSTGEPKGVMQNHVNLLHEMRLYTNGFHITADDRMTLLASCGSGQGIKNAFTALLNGAALYPVALRSEGVARLADFLTQKQITVFHSGIAVFRDFLRTLTGQHRFSDLRLIRLGSQQVLREDVESYKKYFSSSCVLVNALSSTETGTFRWYFMNKDTLVTDSAVPVGYALEDKEVMLLDDHGREIGVNQVGEIVVKSRYVTPGYWRRPDLTESKFRADLTGGEQRCYFTGDLGRMLPDGCLIAQGRKDFRVKIRGYTVELAEVERALREHPAISEAVVVARKNDAGEARLCAYFVSGVQAVPTLRELRKFMQEKLPDYMLPSTFLALDRLPRNSNGKLNRQALPSPGRSRPALEMPFVAPRNVIERQLAETWAETLSIDQVGVDDDFLELGGHSLLAAQIIARVNQVFGIDLSLRSLLDVATVAGLAGLIAVLQGSKRNAERAPAERPLGEEDGEL